MVDLASSLPLRSKSRTSEGDEIIQRNYCFPFVHLLKKPDPVSEVTQQITNALLVIAGMMLSHNLFAQYPIPSFNVPVVVDPTIFEEINPSSGTNFNNLSYSLIKPGSREEKKIKGEIKDQSVLTSAWATIEIYSLSGQLTYGPFTITEGITFELAVSTDELWGIRVLNASEDSKMDVWIE